MILTCIPIKALILPSNVQIVAMGASSEVILFAKVGEVEGSLSNNNDLVVDARPSVLQHPEYIDDSGKFSHSTEKDHYKVCLVEEKLCVNNSSLNGLEVTSEKSTGKNQHLKLTNDTRLKFQFISDEPGKYKIKQGYVLHRRMRPMTQKEESMNLSGLVNKVEFMKDTICVSKTNHSI